MLVPMLEIAQDFVHPLFNKTVEKLYDEIENPEMVCLYGTRIYTGVTGFRTYYHDQCGRVHREWT